MFVSLHLHIGSCQEKVLGSQHQVKTKKDPFLALVVYGRLSDLFTVLIKREGMIKHNTESLVKLGEINQTGVYVELGQ